MKKLNSYILSKQRQYLFNNIWKKQKLNIKQIIPKNKQNRQNFSFFSEKEESQINNNEKIKYPERSFSANSELNTNRLINFNLSNIKENFQIFSSVSNYLLKKKQKMADLNKFKELRQENLKKLLEESKSDQDILGKTFSTKFINEEEFKNLSEAYKKGHAKKLGYKPALNINDNISTFLGKTETQLFNKYNISPNLTLREKNYLNSIKPKSSRKNKHIGITSAYNFYNNQFDSFKSLQKNKNLFNIILLNQEKELIKNYLEKELIDEQNKIKLKLMPKIHIVELSKFKKDNNNIISNILNKSGENNYSKDSFEALNNFVDLNKLSRKELFDEYNYVYLKTINKFISTPTSREGAAMTLYFDENKGIHKMILFGGSNIKSLNDIWECSIIIPNKIDKKYIWKKIKITEDIPSPRKGHTMVIFQGNIFIYGGLVDEIPNKAREDILIYNINEQKFSIDYTLNKNVVGWRNYHIAEIIGPHMFIYGGGDERGNIVAEPYALDLYDMKWMQAKFNTENLPKRKFHSSCQVFPQSKKYSNKFFLFKIYNDISLYDSNKILAEGIYMFGGINENLICCNDLLIIKRGKPLQLFKGIAKGAPPSPRCQCVMEFFEKLNVVIVYGGKNEKSKNGPFFNDMYFLDVQTLSWINIELNNDQKFPTRGGHSSCLVDNELIIFGGKNEKYFLKSDLLICNLDIIENSKFKKVPTVKIKKRKENNNGKDSLNLLNEENHTPLINRFDKKMERIYSNSDIYESSNSSIPIKNNKQLSYNFFNNFPQLRNKLQEKFKEIDGINFNSSEAKKIKEIIKGNS